MSKQTVLHASASDIAHLRREGDVVCSDPPYNVDYHYSGYKDNLPEAEWLSLLAEACPLPCVLILYPEDMYKFSNHIGVIPSRVVSWVYPSNTPRQSRSVAWFGIKPDFEMGGQPYKNPTDKRIQKLIAQGKQARLYDWWEVNQIKNISGEKTAHPCQIPLEVMRRIVSITPAKRIVDPFMGSGTTGVAAKVCDVDFLGAEIVAEYHKIAVDRISQGTELFDAQESQQRIPQPELFD